MQKVLQAATAENDNPDVRDRAYVYWRLLSSDPQIAKNIVLAQRPQISSTIPVLPGPLLDKLIPNLSTLSSVYHKPPSAFLGQGRSSALQEEAIEEAKQNARENPIAAAAVSAAVSGTSTAPIQNTAENLLDFDFDGAAPASMQKAPAMGATGLEGLAGTPQRVASPAITSPTSATAPSGGFEDLMGLSDAPAPVNGGGNQDLMNGFAGLDMNDQPPPQQMNGSSGPKKTNEDLLGLF